MDFLSRSVVRDAAIVLAAVVASNCMTALASEADGSGYQVVLETITQGYDGKPYDGEMCYTQARAGIVPITGQPPLVVVTMSPLKLSGSDVYFELHEMRTSDLGETWLGPFKHVESLGRRPDGMLHGKPVEVVIADFWPKWHARSGTLLGTGHGVQFIDDRSPVVDGRRTTAFSTYDPKTHSWSKWDTVQIPYEHMRHSCGAGCAQRVDLPSGDILLPVYFRPQDSPICRVRVLRCRFDGKRPTVVDAGNEMTIESHRGLAEPSLAVFRGKYYLTLRHDLTAYVAASEDGLHFDPIRKWTWDDGTELGSYNTQAHWVTHSDALYLVYTRRGDDNAHIFRHRAPLFMAEVDTSTLRVRRATERILIPQKGARYGNFGICDVNEHETWIVETEWMQRPPEEPIIAVQNRWGAAARVYVARILWQSPNKAWDQH